MKTHLIVFTILTAGLQFWTQPASADTTTELAELRDMLIAVQTEYQARIAVLERRLNSAEKRVVDANDLATQSLRLSEEVASYPQPQSVASAADFNPAIGVIFSATHGKFTAGDEFRLPGFQTGAETGPVPEGFGLGESEINLKASVDDKFLASLTIAVGSADGETELELEEAFVQSLAMPFHLTITAGRFFSGAGYLNGFHRHVDDFVDRPLSYQAFLGGQYLDDGVQLRWLAPTNQFIEVGAELMRGETFPAAGAGRSGKAVYSVFAKTGADLGPNSAWQAGFSYLNAAVEGRPDTTGVDEFSGDSRLYGLDFVYKWRASRIRSFKLQGEYFFRHESGRYGEGSYRGDQTGWYLQAVHQFRPNWSLGYRRDQLSANNRVSVSSILDDMGMNPTRDSILIEWRNSEFSKVRMQYSQDQSTQFAVDQFVIQYIMSIGAHGAHQF